MLDVKTLIDIWVMLYSGLMEFWNVLSMSIVDVLEALPPPFTGTIIATILTALGGTEFANTPFIVLILGGGVLIFVGITFIKWLIGVIT